MCLIASFIVIPFFIVFLISVCHTVGLRLVLLPPDIDDECNNLPAFSVDTPLPEPPIFLSCFSGICIVGFFFRTTLRRVKSTTWPSKPPTLCHHGRST